MTVVLGAAPSGLVGKVVTPDDRRYGMLCSTYTTVGAPAAVVLPESASDVAAALRLARERGLSVAIRSGGHGLSGSATNTDGLVIDLSAMSRVDVLDRAARLVRVEAGARWGQVTQALSSSGLAISSGDHGNVGVGGLATAGGIGWLVRHFGLTIDRVRAVEVVLADGTMVRADHLTEPDLLWVMRGAGAGAGVAIAFEIEAIELGDVGFVQLVAGVDRAGDTLRRWEVAMAKAPRELSTSVMLSSHSVTPVAFITAVVASDEQARIMRAIQPLLGIGKVTIQQAHVVPYTNLIASAQMQSNTGQMPSHTTNGLFTELTPDAARALVAAASGPDPVLLQMRSLGGAVNDMDPSATAYAHRHQQTMVIASKFPPDAQQELVAAWDTIAPYSDGTYASLQSNPSKSMMASAYPGPTGARVVDLWKRYDPDGVLRQPLGK
ncbi:FAD-binding oxidoreductase [Streptomyces cadmiisoli]|uniref:FAD-binding oxidoreductase n=1 Tax=Streptomyces cadmiisoli TaxID=2184053 RepID=UPI003D707C31